MRVEFIGGSIDEMAEMLAVVMRTVIRQDLGQIEFAPCRFAKCAPLVLAREVVERDGYFMRIDAWLRHRLQAACHSRGFKVVTMYR